MLSIIVSIILQARRHGEGTTASIKEENQDPGKKPKVHSKNEGQTNALDDAIK